MIALLTGPFVGGLVPATLALVLARQARREAYAAGGFLPGRRWIRRGERWLRLDAGRARAATALVPPLAIGVIRTGERSGRPGLRRHG